MGIRGPRAPLPRALVGWNPFLDRTYGSNLALSLVHVGGVEPLGPIPVQLRGWSGTAFRQRVR